MKKIIFSLLLVTAISFHSQAQWVSIPDTNFGNWLNTHNYSSCLQGSSTLGWQLDTTCLAVVNSPTLFVYNSNIADLDGVQYWDNLVGLYCDGNQLATLPNLPDGLINLTCDGNQLLNLPALPVSLNHLECRDNLLTSLPVLPNGLELLYCEFNQLTSLPSLPDSLKYFTCYSNNLTSLPPLPNGLGGLWCSNNQITSLPALPSIFTSLLCDNNQLTSLPSLPATLTRLECASNQLTSLPVLPDSLNRLWCNDNFNLTCLPPMNKVVNLNFLNTSVNCIPNVPSALMASSPDISTMNLCGPGNGNGCAVAPICTGLQFDSIPYTNITCLGANDGSACVYVSGGALPYDFFWSSLITTQCGNNLAPGSYTVSITDSNNCISDTMLTIISPAQLNLHLLSSTGGIFPDTICVYVTGGTPLYSYQWNGNVNPLPNSCFELLSGPFSITVTDDNGCTANDSMTINCSDECIWPGDADYSGLADNNDLLPIGLVYGTSGHARQWRYRDIYWSAHPSWDWGLADTILANGSSGANTIVVADATGIIVGMNAYGTGIGSGALVTNISGTTITLSVNNASNVSGVVSFISPLLLGTINYKHIDCDGNGLINADDTTAILQNFGRTHAKTEDENPWRATDPGLYVELTPDTTQAGDTMYANITLGDINVPASNVYGLAFTLNYDAAVVDSTKTTITFGNSWFGTATDKISIDKNFHSNGQLKCALTRIDHTTRSGFGPIGQAQFVITTDNINGKDLAYYQMNVWISDLVMIDNLGNNITVNQGRDSSQVEFEPVGIADIGMRNADLKIQPNPANDEVQILVTEELVGGELKVMDVEGRILMQSGIQTQNSKLKTQNFSQGIYFIQLRTEKGMLTKRLVIAR